MLVVVHMLQLFQGRLQVISYGGLIRMVGLSRLHGALDRRHRRLLQHRQVEGEILGLPRPDWRGACTAILVHILSVTCAHALLDKQRLRCLSPRHILLLLLLVSIVFRKVHY